MYKTRWAIFRQALSLSFLLLLALYGAIGGILVGSYFNAAAPFLGSVTIKCQDGYSYLGFNHTSYTMFNVYFIGGLLV